MPRKKKSGFIGSFLYNRCHLYPFLADRTTLPQVVFSLSLYSASVNKEIISFQTVVAVVTKMACMTPWSICLLSRNIKFSLTDCINQ